MMKPFGAAQNRLLHYHFLHVGKCGGETIIKVLHDQRLKYTAYHVGTANQDIHDVIARQDERDAFLIPFRDPFSRFVSAFEWDLYSKVLARPGKKAKNRFWQQVFGMFETANDVAEALSDGDRNRREMAELALHSSNLHMQMDLGWYLPPALARRLPVDRTRILRTRHLDRDIPAFLETLGLAQTRPIPHTKSDYKRFIPPHRLTTAPSDLAKSNLAKAKGDTGETLKILEEISKTSPWGMAATENAVHRPVGNGAA